MSLIEHAPTSSVVAAVEQLAKYTEYMSKSDIVPTHYRAKKGNIFIAVQTAYRLNLDPMMVMQNTYVIHGKLGMTSSFAISLANNSGIFKGIITYDIEGSGPDMQATAKATLKETGETISYTVTMGQASAEGWTKNSKYRTLPELMLRYRAAIFLIRTHIPQVLNGMHMVEELKDVEASKTVSEPITVNIKEVLDSADNLLEQKVVQSDDHSQDDLEELIMKHNVPSHVVDAWCEKAGVSEVSELDEDKMVACIALVNNKYNNMQEVV